MIKILDDLLEKWDRESNNRPAINIVDESQMNRSERCADELRAAIPVVEAQQKELVEVLEFANEQMGWLGTGPDNRNIFYCEHCKRSNLDYTLILHEDTCAVTKIRAILARVKGA